MNVMNDMRKPKLFRLVVLAAAWLVAGSAFAWDKPPEIDGVYQIGTLSELYPLPVDDGQHGEVIKNDEGVFCNVDEDAIEQIPESQSTK